MVLFQFGVVVFVAVVVVVGVSIVVVYEKDVKSRYMNMDVFVIKNLKSYLKQIYHEP